MTSPRNIPLDDRLLIIDKILAEWRAKLAEVPLEVIQGAGVFVLCMSELGNDLVLYDTAGRNSAIAEGLAMLLHTLLTGEFAKAELTRVQRRQLQRDFAPTIEKLNTLITLSAASLRDDIRKAP